MIFNVAGRIIRNLIFHYGSGDISIIGEYKYLGVLFKPSGVFSHAIKILCDNAKEAVLHGPSMFAVKAKIYGVHYKQSSSIAYDETSSYWSAPKNS